MIRLPKDMSHNDVSQWLSGGLFFVRTKTDPVLAEWVGIHNGTVECALLDGTIIRRAHTSCYAVWPDLGAFNVPTQRCAVFLERIVDRQYRRTFHHRAVSIHVPMAYYISREQPDTAIRLRRWATVKYLPFNPVYPSSWDEAEAWLNDGWRTVAVNRRVIVGGMAGLDKRMIYLDGTLAANVRGGQVFFTCTPEQQRELVTFFGGRFDAYL